jgi:hypothetical protein
VKLLSKLLPTEGFQPDLPSNFGQFRNFGNGTISLPSPKFQEDNGYKMNRFYSVTCLAVGVFLFGSMAFSQTTDIKLRAVDGRNGKPLANQHLLVFTGMSSDDVRNHTMHTGIMTDKYGLVTLTVTASETQWIQVWADGRVLCQKDPNQLSFSVAAIMSTGLTTPNTCSSLIREPTPGHFIVFARPARFMEKMRH